MSDNLQPLPDEHLEARITAWVLGEASSFEAAELKELVEKSPELKLFTNRLRTLHALLPEAEDSSGTGDGDWKLSPGRKFKLTRALGETPEIPRLPFEKRDNRRFARIAAFAIAACALFAAFLLALTRPDFIERKLSRMTTSEPLVADIPSETPEMRELRINELKKAIREQEDKVEEGRKVLTTISRTKDIVYYGDRGLGNREEAQGAAYAMNEFNRLEGEKVQLETQIESLLQYDSEQLLTYASGIDLPDNIIKSLYPQKLELQRQIDGLKASGLADRHPTVQTNQRVLDSMKADLDEGVVNLRTRLQGQLESSKERLSKIELAKNDSKRDALERSIDTQDYVDAKRDFETDQTLLEQMKLALIGEEIASKLSDKETPTLLTYNATSPSSPPAPSEKPNRTAVARKPSSPSSSLSGEIIGANTTSPTPVPSPDSQPVDYGDGISFGTGWADDRQLAKNGYREEYPLADTAPSEPGSQLASRSRKADASKKETIADKSAADMDAFADAETIPVPSEFARQTDPPAASQSQVLAEEKQEMEIGSADPFADESASGGALYARPPIDLSQEIPAAQEPFSTFSLNISDASFQLARTAIEKGERPDPASIKPEQFYNAIDYGDPAPSSREPVAAAIDQTSHPVIPGRNLVRIAVRTASTGRSAAQPLRLTLLVDQSGSMVREDRRAAMETALAQLATLLTEQDRITVIGFSRTPRLLADSLPGNQANKLPDLINQTASEGGTNLEQAINLASELALRHKLAGAQNRIVLFTDGAANLGNADPERLAEKVKELRQQGLAFDIAGIGTDDLNDNLLAELARHGNGRYYLVGENTASALASQLAGAFRPAAENVKVQVKLNPERVGSYKLIGFEKDRLATEDFRNDSIDAAELAADEAGVAMYQIETLPEGSGEIGEVSVRFRDTTSGEMVERTWTIAYDPTTPAFDQADPKTQLATLSLLAAQKLQGGPLADAINLGNFSETIAELRQTYKADPKTQQLLSLVNSLK